MSDPSVLSQLKVSMQGVFSLFPLKTQKATYDSLGLVRIDSATITASDGKISLTQANVNSALGSTAVTSATNASYAPSISDTTDSTTKIANTEFVQKAVSEKIAESDAMIYKGTIGTVEGTIHTLPDKPKVGWTYKVADRWVYSQGTTSQVCETGDMIICQIKSTAAAPATWNIIQGNIDGAVITTSSSVSSDTIAIFNGTNGRIIKSGEVTITTLNSNISARPTTSEIINQIDAACSSMSS